MIENKPRYKHLVVNDECEEKEVYHDDMHDEGVQFIVPINMKNMFRDFRIFNGMRFFTIDSMLQELVPVFNQLEARCKCVRKK